MSKKKNKVVYSTNPNFNFSDEEEEDSVTIPSADQLLYVSIDKKKRAGKEVTLIEGFVGQADDLSILGKEIKSKCGVGGTVKEGVILIQGNFRDRIVSILEEKGFRVKRKGG